MDVYFAAPLFSDAEKEFNARLTERLEEAGHDVFLPQRDGMEIAAIYDQPDVDGVEDVMDEVFETDRDEVYAADVVLAVLDGQVPDEGVAIEMGIAYERGVPIVGLKTDNRTFSKSEPINAMLWGVLDELHEEPDAAIQAIEERAAGDDG